MEKFKQLGSVLTPVKLWIAYIVVCSHIHFMIYKVSVKLMKILPKLLEYLLQGEYLVSCVTSWMGDILFLSKFLCNNFPNFFSKTPSKDFIVDA